MREGIAAVLERRAWPFRYEYRCDDVHGEDRWYEIFVDCLMVTEGGAIVTHLDITDRRRAEEARRQVAHMGRVMVVGELATTISHELRQPLAAIRANAEAGRRLLAHPLPDLPELRDILDSIVADDARAVELIEGVRKMMRKEPAGATAVDLNEICREAARLLQHEAIARTTRLELVLSPAPPMVSGDPVQLRQVVLNLALNALEAAAAGGGDRFVVVRTQARGDEVELQVRDSGAGISPAVAGHLFESFFSTKRSGLGLGLVIVRSIVERHSGQVGAENHAQGGAVFRVRLPVGRAADQERVGVVGMATA